MCDDAMAVFEQERAFAGDTPTTRAKQAHVLASCGNAEEARALLDGLIAGREREWVTAYEIAVINSLLGDADAAFAGWRAPGGALVGLTLHPRRPASTPPTDPRSTNSSADSRL